MADDQDVAAEIEALAERSKAAMARGDLEAALSEMTDDVVFVAANGPPVVGKDALRAQYQGLLSKHKIENTATRADFRVEPLGDNALVVGNDSAVITPVGHGPITKVSGRAVSVFRREAGVWKLARSLNLMTPTK